VLASSGYFHYRGHMHNSGFVGLYLSVDVVVKIPGTQAAFRLPSHQVNVGGTTSIDDRDEDWDQEGTSPEVAAHWEALRYGASATMSVEAQLGAFEFFELIFLPAIAVATIYALVTSDSGGPPTYCHTSNYQITTDGNNRTVREPTGTSCGHLTPDRPDQWR
jgi:hypothetical protein